MSLVLKISSLLLFLYLPWRNLKDDYPESEIIRFGWLSLFFACITGRILYGLINWGVWNDNLVNWLMFWQKPGFDYLGGLIGLILYFWWSSNKNDWKIWAYGEDFLPYWLILVGLMLGSMLVGGTKDKMLTDIIIIFGGELLYWIIGQKYRSWGWYKSGKKGFRFFFVTMLLFAALATKSWLLSNWEVSVIEAILSLLFVAGLFILGEVLPVKGGK